MRHNDHVGPYSEQNALGTGLFLFKAQMDESTAISEGAVSPSPTDGATGASGIDTTQGQQPAEPSQQTQTQTAPEAGQEEFSAGWSFDDEGEKQSAIPEADDDIQGMLNDPALDQKQVPKLVEDLRGARAEARQSRSEIKQLREQLAKLEQLGGLETVEQTAGLVNGLIHNPEEGTIPFLTELAQKATPAYWQLVDSLVQYESDNLIAKLQEAGKIPEVQPQAAAGALTADDWARIPKELHDVAKQVPVNQLLQWLDNGTDESLAFNLNTHKELAELKGAQRQQAEQQWRQSVQQAEQQAVKSIEELSNNFQKAHLAQLSKWQPFGPQADSENQRLYKMVMEGAFAELLQDKQWATVHRDAVAKLQNAPLRRLKNEHMAADVDERDARGAAFRFNAKLGQVMKEMTNSLDSAFRDARAWREYQRQSAPERKEIPGMNNTASNGGSNGVPALDENGNISDGFMSRLTERMKGWRG